MLILHFSELIEKIKKENGLTNYSNLLVQSKEGTRQLLESDIDIDEKRNSIIIDADYILPKKVHIIDEDTILPGNNISEMTVFELKKGDNYENT